MIIVYVHDIFHCFLYIHMNAKRARQFFFWNLKLLECHASTRVQFFSDNHVTLQRLPEARANSLQQEKGGGQKNQWDVLCQNPMMFSCVFHEWIASISHFANSSPFFWVFALNPEWMLINVLRVARCYHLGVFSWVSHTSSILDDKYEGNWCPNYVSQGEQKLPGLSGGIRVSQPVEWWTKTRRLCQEQFVGSWRSFKKVAGLELQV